MIISCCSLHSVFASYDIFVFHSSYQSIKDKSNRQWAFGYASLVSDYVLLKERHVFCMLPPPLNIVTTALAPIHYYFQFNHQVSIGGTVTNFFYDGIVGGLIRLPMQLWIAVSDSMFLFFELVFMCIKMFHKTNDTVVHSRLGRNKLEVFTKGIFFILPCFALTLIAFVIWTFCVLLDIIWIPCAMIFYSIYLPILLSFTNKKKNVNDDDNKEDDDKRKQMRKMRRMVVVSLQKSDGTIKRGVTYHLTPLTSSTANDNEMTKKGIKRGLPSFPTEDIDSILKPLKSYIKSVGNEDLARVEHNIIHETERHMKAHFDQLQNHQSLSSSNNNKDDQMMELREEFNELKQSVHLMLKRMDDMMLQQQSTKN